MGKRSDPARSTPTEPARAVGIDYETGEMHGDRGVAHRADPIIVFWSRVHKTHGCWLWTAAVDKDGYGKFQVTISSVAPKQAHYRAHRYAFFLEHGRWPTAGLLHSCHVPGCVNPAHISEGTQSQNVVDTVLRRTHRLVRATPDLVREWRRRHLAGERITEIAHGSGFAYSTVEHAITRRSWRHVA